MLKNIKYLCVFICGILLIILVGGCGCPEDCDINCKCGCQNNKVVIYNKSNDQITKKKYNHKRSFMHPLNFMNPANPISPISPMNHMSPANPMSHIWYNR